MVPKTQRGNLKNLANVFASTLPLGFSNTPPDPVHYLFIYFSAINGCAQRLHMTL